METEGIGFLIIFRIRCAGTVDFLPKFGRFPILTCLRLLCRANQEHSWAPGSGDNTIRLPLDPDVSRHPVDLYL